MRDPSQLVKGDPNEVWRYVEFLKRQIGGVQDVLRALNEAEGDARQWFGEAGDAFLRYLEGIKRNATRLGKELADLERRYTELARGLTDAWNHAKGCERIADDLGFEATDLVHRDELDRVLLKLDEYIAGYSREQVREKLHKFDTIYERANQLADAARWGATRGLPH
ncbi:hypothetical protein HCC61_17340 [Streptomyces sp. HNM0575]|uniref:hypothetical protein n=1 Tax=Streptomyces sp. HNM0575 TaxID=2716338 RepID=UPI00145CFDA1|nr:hypothetical protein [Streptomyces sp. HNM0575]NLU74424.1 hypothetical protein [Streptomyces sp. HNM0575]